MESQAIQSMTLQDVTNVNDRFIMFYGRNLIKDWNKIIQNHDSQKPLSSIFDENQANRLYNIVLFGRQQVGM